MRVLAAIWLVQILTALVVWLALTHPTTWQLVLSTGLALGIGAMAAIWLRGTMQDQVKLQEARYSERLALKTQEFSKKLSAQKSHEAERLAELARKTGNSRTGLLKAGILTGGALGLGAALVMAQFVGMALLLAAFSGGGAAGYFLSSKTRKDPKPVIDVSPQSSASSLPKPKRLRLRNLAK